MSLPAKAVLFTSCAATFGIVGYVHFKQKDDRDKLHEGVIKDVERQQKKKIENTYLLQQQIDLAKQLKKDLAMSETESEK